MTRVFLPQASAPRPPSHRMPKESQQQVPASMPALPPPAPNAVAPNALPHALVAAPCCQLQAKRRWDMWACCVAANVHARSLQTIKTTLAASLAPLYSGCAVVLVEKRCGQQGRSNCTGFCLRFVSVLFRKGI